MRHGFLLPARVVMAVFRGKMLGALRWAFARDALVLPEAMRPQQFLNLLNRLGHAQKTPWNVHIRERYRHGAGVVTHLARYLRGGPIKNARLVAYDGDCVTFTYRTRQGEADAGPAAPQRMTWSVADFAAVAPPCPRAADAGGAVVWTVSPDAGEGPRGLPYRPWATAGGGARAADLADGVRPAWGGPSRAVSHLRAAARVHRRDPARGCATACTGWGARSMRTTRDTLLGEAAEECGVPGVAQQVAQRGQGSGLGA